MGIRRAMVDGSRRFGRVPVALLLCVTFGLMPFGAGAGGAALRPNVAPVNDDFVAATALGASSGTVTGSTVGATKQTGEPDHAGNAGGHSVWWSWTPVVGGLTTIDTCASNFDTLLAVYTGSAVDALKTVVADDDGRLCGFTAVQSSVYFNAVAGTTYRIAVDGYNGASGAVSLRVVAPDAQLPGGPSITATASGNGWLNVGWDPPVSDGGNPISRYTVTLSTGETIDVPGDAHAATLLVTNDTARTAHVTATNAVGTGPASAESDPITPTAAPLDVTTTYDDDGSTRLNANAASFAQSPEDAQRTSVYVLAYLVGLVGGPVAPLADAGATGPHAYTTTWGTAEQFVLTTVTRKYCLTPSEAQQFSVRLVGYLLALGGN